MSAKYASYFNIEINSALWGSGIIFLTNTLTIDATRLLPIYGINGKKAIVAPGGIGNET
jgi:hypothetical protein